VSLALSYQKSGNTLSAAMVNAGSGSSASAPQPGGTLPWVIGSAALGLALVGGGVTWYLRRKPAGRAKTRGGRAARRARAERAPAKPAVPGAASAAGAGFCTQCGQRHRPGDRFCRQCGAPVRE